MFDFRKRARRESRSFFLLYILFFPQIFVRVPVSVQRPTSNNSLIKDVFLHFKFKHEYCHVFIKRLVF